MQTMHIFAGGGGGLLADLILGHDPICAVEWEPYACQILRERAAEGWFPELHVHEGDVRLFDPSEYAGRVGCIHAGFPCQDLSNAGKQAGLGEGTRSGLYREVLRIAGVVRPRYLFLENVSAILSHGLGTVLGDLAAMGYDCRWSCVKASDVGAPHGRDRWWCLCERVANPEGERERRKTGDVLKTDGRQVEQLSQQLNGSSAGAPTEFCNATSAGLSQRTVEHMGRSSEVEESKQPICKIPNANSFNRSANGVEQNADANWRDESGGICTDVSGAQCKRSSGQGLYGGCNRKTDWFIDSGENEEGGGNAESGVGKLVDELAYPMVRGEEFQGWWEVEPDIGRVTTGCDNRAAQLKALGNGQVPLQAALAWRLLGGE